MSYIFRKGCIVLLLLGGCSQPGDMTLPGALRQGAFLTEEQGRTELQMLLERSPDLKHWKYRRKELRKGVLTAMNLHPLPPRTPLKAIYRNERHYDAYTVCNVAIETIPGFFLCGNLYRPLTHRKKYPAILCPHGHFNSDSLLLGGRFREDMQKRCANLARMGAVVLSYSMYGYGENVWQVDTLVSHPGGLPVENTTLHDVPFALTMQTWNGIRALDFLSSLEDVDRRQIGVTGASGGGTQSFLLAALDRRIKVCVPVVMVSCHFFGGCNCESGLPVHCSVNPCTNNTELAAMVAPRPMLLISDGDDWTRNTPGVEYPYLRTIYGYFNAVQNIENIHFPEGKHDYGYEKRVTAFRFLARYLGLDLNTVTASDGSINENDVVIEPPADMLVFDAANPLPHYALKGEQQMRITMESLRK